MATATQLRLRAALERMGSRAAASGTTSEASGAWAAHAARSSHDELCGELTDAGWEQVAPHVHVRTQDADPPAELAASPCLLPEGAERHECIFYDTETTGFGGAGVVVFLVGLGWWERGRLRVQQVFLSDYPGERDFLRYIREAASRYGVFVSYNGKSFDSHVLESRFVLSGMTMAVGYQLDLLHVARRLWRGITADCRLPTIERHVLGMRRQGDVPGQMVPDLYFDCLRSGSLGRMPEVFEHNRLDVASLVLLLEAMQRLMAGRDLGVATDGAALGDMLLQRGRSNAVEVLSSAYQSGDVEAGRLLSLHHKRACDIDAALLLWQDMFDRHKSLFAAVELSKHYEHRRRDYHTALSYLLPYRVLERALGDGSELGKRIARLRRKLDAAAGAAAGGGARSQLSTQSK